MDRDLVEMRTLVKAQEIERARIARELHDGVGQKLALLRMDLDQIARALSSREHRAQVQELSVKVAEIARELHDVSHQLHPSRLQLLGLTKSIEALCLESSLSSGVKITFSCDGDLSNQVGSNESLCLYRVAQEALHNVVKHSNAVCADVRLVCLRGALRLVVTDGGQGFDSSVATNGMGLTSMRQRVQLLNGTMAVQTCRGGGTSIDVRIPVALAWHDLAIARHDANAVASESVDGAVT